MKKILLSLFVATVATSTFAQTKNVDWAVTSILTPTELQSTNTGTAVVLDVVLTNLGTDSVLVGDSIYIQWAIANMQNQALVLYPGSTTANFAVVLAKKDMGVNDTMHFKGSFNVNLKVNFSGDYKVFFTSLIVNRARGLNFESSIPNNALSKQLIWYNPQRWGVSVSSITNQKFEVFPNPAKTTTNISLNIVDVNANVNIAVLDAMGRVVMNNTFANSQEISLNTVNLKAGVYFVKVTNGTLNSTQKLIVE